MNTVKHNTIHTFIWTQTCTVAIVQVHVQKGKPESLLTKT